MKFFTLHILGKDNSHNNDSYRYEITYDDIDNNLYSYLINKTIKENNAEFVCVLYNKVNECLLLFKTNEADVKDISHYE